MKREKNNNNNSNSNRILLVDDEYDITLSIGISLEDNGFAVDAFNDPLEGLSSFKKGVYALALLDFKMPKMNGFELYDKIRKIDDKIRICIITAYDIQQDDVKATAEWTTLNEEESPVVIRKPISPTDLVQKVKKELECSSD